MSVSDLDRLLHPLEDTTTRPNMPHPQVRKVADFRPAPRNARTHSRKQVRQIADSFRAFGFTNPVLVDGAGQVIAGHGRLAVAQLLGSSRSRRFALIG